MNRDLNRATSGNLFMAMEHGSDLKGDSVSVEHWNHVRLQEGGATALRGRRGVEAGRGCRVPVAACVCDHDDVFLDVVPVDKPDDVNVVIGQAHFIKTVEDLHAAMVGVSSSLRFGLPSARPPGHGWFAAPAMILNWSSSRPAMRRPSPPGTALVIFLRGPGSQSTSSTRSRRCPGCTIHCATANPVDILVAVTPRGRGIVGVVDGQAPLWGGDRSRRGRPARPAARHRLQA